MDKNQATEIMQNLVFMHRSIHWGNVNNMDVVGMYERRYGDKLDTNLVKKDFFYYKSLSEYACELDQYMYMILEEIDLSEFESNVRAGIRRMIQYVSEYNIDLYTKTEFIESRPIAKVFKILNINIDDVLQRVSENHKKLKSEYHDIYLSYYDRKIKNMIARINNSNQNETLSVQLEAMQNLKNYAEKEKLKYNGYLDMADTFVDNLVPNEIYNLALAQEVKRILIEKKENKRENQWKKIKKLFSRK